MQAKFSIMKQELFNRQNTTYLRGLAIIAIVIHHIFQYTASKYGVVYPFFLSILLSNLGNMGCSVFFLLSGFGLSCSVRKNSPISLSYIYKHLIKLLNPFLFIWLIDTCIHYSDGISLSNLFTLSIYSNQYWFLKEIFLLYLVFLIPCYLRGKNNILMALSTTILVIILIALKLDSFWWNTTFCFPLGVLCSSYKDKIIDLYKRYHSISLISSFVIFVISFGLSYFVSYFEILRAISFALFMVMIVSYHRYNIKFFDICSAESLKIYLFHVSLLQFFTIQNSIVYSLMVILGTVALTYCYNQIMRMIASIKICKEK